MLLNKYKISDYERITAKPGNVNKTVEADAYASLSAQNLAYSLIPQDSPPNFSEECSQNVQDEIYNRPPIYDEDIYDDFPPSDEDIYDGRVEENTGCNDDRIAFPQVIRRKGDVIHR